MLFAVRYVYVYTWNCNVGMNVVAAAAVAAAVNIKSSIITAVGCVFIALMLVRLDCSCITFVILQLFCAMPLRCMQRKCS